MQNVRRGFTSAAAERLLKIGPSLNKLGQFPNSCLRFPLPHPPSLASCVRNVDGKPRCRNYLHLIKESSEMAKLYDRVGSSIQSGSTKSAYVLEKCGLEGSPKNPWQEGGRCYKSQRRSSTLSQYTQFENLRTKPRLQSIDSTRSKQSDRSKTNNSHDKRRPMRTDRHKSIESSAFINRASFLSFISNTSAENLANATAFNFMSRIVGQNQTHELLSPMIPNTNSDTPFLIEKVSAASLTPSLKKFLNDSTDPVDNGSSNFEDDNTCKRPRNFSNSIWDPSRSICPSIISSSSKLETEALPTGPVHSFLFPPIDLSEVRENFIQYIDPNDFIDCWPKIWPLNYLETTRPKGAMQKKAISRRMARKLLTRRLSKTVSCQTEGFLTKHSFKYHTYTMGYPKTSKFCDRVRRKRVRQAVGCQTEWDDCELCCLSRQSKEPEKPYMTEMRDRQAHEELRQNILKSRDRLRVLSNNFPKYSQSSSSKSDPPKTSNSKRNLQQMRLQLHKCLTALAFCGHLVDRRLQERRCRKRNSGVVSSSG